MRCSVLTQPVLPSDGERACYVSSSLWEGGGGLVTYALRVDRLPHTLTNAATNNASITEVAAGGLPTAVMQGPLNATNNSYMEECLTTHSGREYVHSHDFNKSQNLSEPYP
jgi:hypothetical protein